MKAPSLLWSAVFFVVVALAEYLFGHVTVATVGTGIASLLAGLLKMWEEWQKTAAASSAPGTRAAGPAQKPYWRRVVLG